MTAALALLRCCRCGQDLPPEAFYQRSTNGARGYSSACRECFNIKRRRTREIDRHLRLIVGGGEPVYEPCGDWAYEAACRHQTGVMDEWSPLGKREGRTAQIARQANAKAICAACPVLEECRVWVMQPHDPCAVQGAPGLIVAGMTTRERRALRRDWT